MLSAGSLSISVRDARSLSPSEQIRRCRFSRRCVVCEMMRGGERLFRGFSLMHRAHLLHDMAGAFSDMIFTMLILYIIYFAIKSAI